MLRRATSAVFFFFLVLSIVCAALPEICDRAISINGKDSRDCTLGHPCRTFARLASETSNQGDMILCVESGYYVESKLLFFFRICGLILNDGFQLSRRTLETDKFLEEKSRCFSSEM